MRDFFDLFVAERVRTTTEPGALRASPLEPSEHPLSDAFTFELSQRRQDVQLKSARCRTQVQTISKGEETHAERLPVLDDSDEMTERPAETVERDDHDDIDL